MNQEYIFPLDLDCPDVRRFYTETLTSAMSLPVFATLSTKAHETIADELESDFEHTHRRSCERCKEYGAANVVIAPPDPPRVLESQCVQMTDGIGRFVNRWGAEASTLRFPPGSFPQAVRFVFRNSTSVIMTYDKHETSSEGELVSMHYSSHERGEVELVVFND